MQNILHFISLFLLGPDALFDYCLDYQELEVNTSYIEYLDNSDQLILNMAGSSAEGGSSKVPKYNIPAYSDSSIINKLLGQIIYNDSQQYVKNIYSQNFPKSLNLTKNELDYIGERVRMATVSHSYHTYPAFANGKEYHEVYVCYQDNHPFVNRSYICDDIDSVYADQELINTIRNIPTPKS